MKWPRCHHKGTRSIVREGQSSYTIIVAQSRVNLICLIAPTMCGKRDSKCGGGWTPSVGSVTSLVSDSASHDSEKVFAPRAKITDQELSCRQMQPTRAPKQDNVEVGSSVDDWGDD